jgi:hypothetical protein
MHIVLVDRQPHFTFHISMAWQPFLQVATVTWPELPQVTKSAA